jgi:hypothetical protein
LLSVF